MLNTFVNLQIFLLLRDPSTVVNVPFIKSQQRSTELRWEPRHCEGDVPSKRSGHSFTETGNGMAFLFGGVAFADRTRFDSKADADGRDVEFDVLDDITNLLASGSGPNAATRPRVQSGPTNDMFRLELSGGSSSDGDMYWNRVETQSVPPVRWQHTANFSDKLNTIIVFGGFGEESCRLNDLWMFDVQSETWTQPHVSSLPNSSLDPCSPWVSGPVDKELPSPRGAHASTLVCKGLCLVIFGGYGGGGGHTRRDLSDIHVFHIPSCQWHTVATTGTPPPARSGHRLLASLSNVGHDNLYVMGGWSACQQFDDVYVLENDGSTLTWSKLDTASGPESWGPKRWNFGAVSVPAVPNWKIFIFGGNSGELDQARPQGLLQNNLQVLECGHSESSEITWYHPVITGNCPCPRSDTPIIHCQDSGKIFLFGGWSTRWHDDMFACDVSDIVGPPYNIFSVKAVDWDKASSPITGGTELLLSGQGFSTYCGGSSTATVRFACSKGYREVTGDLKGDKEIACKAPEFSSYGPDEKVNVTVKIGANKFTNNALPFSFFSVTDASQTVAFGPGILSGIGKGNEASFVIQAKDERAKDRVCGMDRFNIKIRHLGDDQPIVNIESHNMSLSGCSNGISIVAGTKMKAMAARIKRKFADGTVPFEIEDRHDGTYLIKYTPPEEGKYKVDIEFDGTFHGQAGVIRGSPFEFSVTTGSDESASALDGNLLCNSIEVFIAQLKEFSLSTATGLGKTVSADDLRSLVAVKEHLRNFSRRKTALENGIASNRAALVYLKERSFNVPYLGRFLQDMDSAISAWNTVKAILPETVETISDVDEVWRGKIRFKIEAYSKELEGKHELFRKLPFWSYHHQVSGATIKLGCDAAKQVISRAFADLECETHNLDENAYLCNIFELGGLIASSQKHLEDMKTDLLEMTKLWEVSAKLETLIDSSKNMFWKDLNLDTLEECAKSKLKEVKALHKCTRWCDAFTSIDKICKDFLATIPLIVLLGSKCMRPRHWKSLINITGAKNVVPPCDNDSVPLGDVLTMNLLKFSNDVEEICDQASKEDKMERTLKQIEERWTGINFIMVPYEKKVGNVVETVPLLGIGEEDFESLENDQLLIQGMMASRFLAQFEQEVTGWQKALFNVSEVFLLVNDIQRTWTYLEPLFIHSEEVKRELPEDATRFIAIDIDTRSILHKAWSTKNVNRAFNQNGLIDKLEGIQEQLDICKKSLSDFLDGRRRQFPRYYFVSEADLLDILSNGGNPEKILSHISKIYLSTKTLTLSEHTSPTGRPFATEFVSGVGSEVCTFEPAVPLEGKVEVYMQTILDAQKKSIFETVKRSLDRYHKMPRHEWVFAKDADTSRPLDPAQTTLLVLAINYVKETEEALTEMRNGASDALTRYSEKQVSQLSDLIKLTHTDLSKGDRTRVMVCITMDAHARDIVEKMIRSKVSSIDSFIWQSQLKHKFRVPPSHARYQGRDTHLRGQGGERAEVAICDAVLPYDYEYLGNGPRLVITPLTDRVYVTATQALNLKMGCAPAGPAGTGKTETTKDLANALAKLIYVINCSPEMDYKGLGNIFKGVASSGAWVCFDEFNRLVPEVLSVCTVQFKSVCDGIAADATRIRIEGDEINLDPTCGAFITMNPGYLGRSELPEGLKALFRPMTVMVPDLILICENMLMAEGFVTAKALASKFFCLYSLLKALLSAQLHYDWGLRAIKSVLVVAGGFKRAEPNLAEDALLMRALRDFNVPKIVQDDEVIFFGLLGDLFPGIDPPRKRDESLESYVYQACANLGNNADETFCLKVVQTEELLAIRHCVFIMGPAGSGKSQCWRTLKEARNLRDPDIPTKVVDLNPKAVKTEELYGYINMATREWKDGLLSNIMRHLSSIPDENPKWIVLDGDLDANWIESMNSVMDDNRMLTLASNERIPLLPHMRMIFEIRDLKHATPATVSRAGIVYISSEGGSQWKSLVCSWISKKCYTKEITALFRSLFDKYISKTLLWLLVNTKSVVPVEDMNRVQVLLNMLNGCLNEDHISNPSTIETAFVYCAVWALGSTLTAADDGTDYRKLFSEWWRDEFKDVKFPSRDTVFEYWLDPASNTFDSWTKSPFFYSVSYDSQKMSMTQVTVPTSETCSVAYWIDMLVRMRKPVMLAGPAGTGKTQLVTGMIKKFKPSSYTSSTINFNFYTTSAVLAEIMAIPLEKKTGSNYGPPGQKKLVYFIDDLNLPEVDTYNTQSAIAHLRQHMEYEHCYDLQKMTPKNISNTQVVSCMNPTAGCFNINPRLQRWFATFAMGLPTPTSLLTIYQTFLDGHLHNFTDEIRSHSTNLIKAALGLHSLVGCTFRKTATNFHYEFNIRHISNVFQGLLVSTPENFKSVDKFTLLWLHESERVYGDRLVCADDFSKYNSLAQSQCKKVFPAFPTAKYYAKENAEPLLFCHFSEGIEDNTYNQVSSLVTMSRVLEECLKEYNESNPNLDLVLFEDAMKHIARIVRIVRNEGGHALLVGVGGSGKQSLARLAAFICGYNVVQIVISGTYSINDLKDDLKGMFIKAGVKDEGVMFLLTDSQITNERFLIYINDFLASGDVPDLFAVDDVDAIVHSVTSRVKEAGIVPERKNCWDYFISRVRKNLHVCLCFSPVGDGFRNRARRFPALVNCTVIDMFQPWPKEALLSVGKKFLSQVDLGFDRERDVIERFLPFSFEAVNKATIDYRRKERRSVYTTPKSYLELIKLYKILLEDSRSDSTAAILRLDNGLMKLRDTSERVAKLEHDLKEMLEDAAVKKEKAELIAATVSKEKAIAEVETSHAQMEKEQVAKIAEEVGQKQRDTENDLAKAEPAVEAAMQALDTLDQKDLSSCKGMLKPPPKLDEVFAATMCLLAGIMPSVVLQKNGKVKDVSWDAAKKQLMGNIKEYMTYLKEIKTHVDNGTINPQNFKEVREYIEKDYFNVETIRTKNQAAAGLCSFVLNIVTYYDIVVTVEPKRQALAEANKQLTEANEKLKVVMENVEGLEKKLATLTKELEEAEASKKEAMDAVAGSERKLNLAQRLTNALSSENRRWAENIVALRKKEKLLTGDVLLASAFISYIGPFTKHFRIHLMEKVFRPFLVKEFGKIATELGGEYIMPLSEAANPISTLTTPAEVAQWNADSLPADAVSTENGCLVCNSSRWPLIIDPQLQGIKWVKQKESGPQRNLQVVRLGQKDLIRKLELAMENGFTILIENLGESIDAVLMPVIQRATIKRGTKLFIKIGDKEVDFHPEFRLYLHTKLSNPHYPPEIQAETTLINFTVTMAGLEDQLLNLVVEKERPDLAALSSKLVNQQNGFKIKMKELEDDILHKLATAEGDITENVALIEGLEETKRITDDIQQKSELALKTQTDILATSEKYRSVANRSSLLFFLMNDLVKIHTYYIYSLAAFQQVFFRGIETSGEHTEGDSVATRCDVLCRNITLSTFNYIRRGLFEADKLTVAALLIFKILVNDGKIEPDEVDFLINRGSCADPGNMGPLHDWMPDIIWPKVKALECMPRFKGIGDSMQSESDAWEAWFDVEKVEEVAIPGAFNKKLNDLDRLMLLRAMRPDRLMNSLISYVGNTLGPEYITQKPFSMAATYAETNKRTPIFFVLFPGVDPTPWVECLGKEKGVCAENKRFVNISMGQGQEAPAEAIITMLAKEGGWVMLQNCHLMSSWVPKLERLLEVVAEDAHEDFRCFISAEPPPIASMKNMPESLMQSCVKVANEASSDVKSSLIRAWDHFSPETYESCSMPNKMKACLFSLCWFHAVVCGRRRFGQQGWSRHYSFNTGDLIICSNVLKSYLDTNAVIPWDDLRYIFGEIMYGGHITDAWDRRTCNTYLQEYQREELFTGLELAPGFKSPPPGEMDYDDYVKYTETSIPVESPLLFGLHPNAEIGYLTNSTEKLFFDILAMGGGADGGICEDSAHVVREVMTNIVDRLPEEFEMVSLSMKAKQLLEGPTGPYVVVALQECGRMNALVSEIRSSVSELDKGLKGQLNMSQAMEDLVSAFVLNQWPGRNPFSKCMWEKLAWPSQKNLMSQFADMLLRIDQLVRWTQEFETPKSIWLPGLFNPSSYLTAAQQVTARKTGLALDKMTIETHVTTMWDSSEVKDYAEDGTYIHGLYLEGARWPKGDEAGDPYDVCGTPCAGALCDSKLKDLLPLTPVIYVKSVPIQRQWEASPVGYLRHDPNIYECPVYITSFRGPTFIFVATLRSKDNNNKWTLLGVALLLQTDS
eukprot:CCRYP_006874-RA/>CCRYP_006874-RA protein AED:0.08 eAED:0.09 QI:0/0/0.5/1/0/0/2/139/4220